MAKKKPSFASRAGKVLSTINSPTFRTGFSKIDLWVSTSNYAMNRLWSGRFDKALLFGRNYVFYGESGCHAKGTKVVMYDGTLKTVEDVMLGDLLMGPDSKPREVLRLIRGHEQMYKIIPNRGEEFVVNENHILSLTGGNDSRNQPVQKDTVMNMTVKDYLKQTEVFQERTRLYRTGVNFQSSDDLLIDPYILGAWLGDGSSTQGDITTMDDEIRDAFTEYLTSIGASYTIVGKSEDKKAYTVRSRKAPSEGVNRFTQQLRTLDIFGDKHIPHEYLVASEKDRLALLAGLIDTDGTLASGYMNIIQKREDLMNQIVFLARSLGFYVHRKKKIKHWKHNDEIKHGEYYSCGISGDIDRIPTKLPRKQAQPRLCKKNWLQSGFVIEDAGHDDFYGFTLSDDHLYLLEDFTVTHNSGKSLFCAIVAGNAQREHDAYIVWIDVEHANDDEAGHQWLKRAGIDTSEENFLYTSASTLEEIKTIIAKISKDYQKAKEAGEELPPVVFIVDSWAAALTESQWEKTGGKDAGKVVGDMGQKAKQIGDVINSVTHLCAGLPLMVIGVQHIMDNQDPYGRKHKTTGGNKMLYYASGCMMLSKNELKLEDSEDPEVIAYYEELHEGMSAEAKKAAGANRQLVGINSKMEIIKSRVSKPFDKVNIQIPYKTGIDPYSGLFVLLQQEGTITVPSVGWYQYHGENGEVVKFRRADFLKHADAIMEYADQDISKPMDDKPVDDNVNDETDAPEEVQTEVE